MARTFTTEHTAYTWEELSDSAKDRAREQHSRFLWDTGSMAENLGALWEGTLEPAGWENLSGLAYSLYTQGGYPSWSGDLPAFEHGGRAYYVTVRDHHYYGMQVDVEEGDGAEPLTREEHAAVTEAAREHIRDLSSQLYQAFTAEEEYQTADEQMAETSEANGYEYYVNIAANV